MAETWTPKFEGTTDANTPLVNGRLETFVAGTLNPLATYTDQSGAVENANPVVLDGAGRANVWLTPGVKYKLVLRKPPILGQPGGIVWTQDNFSVSDPSLAGTLNGAGGAGAIKYQLVEDGSGIRTLQSKLEELATSQDFTVGTSNQRMQFALDAAAQGANGDRGAARLNEVVTLVNNGAGSALEIRSGTHLDGTGGKLNFGYQTFYGIRGVGVTEVSITNLVMQSSSTFGNDAQAAVTFRGDGLGTDAWGLSVMNSALIGTSWGVLVTNESASDGTAYNVRFGAMDVRSYTIGAQSDGLHAAGKITGCTMFGCTVYGRGDAAFANSATPTANGTAMVVGASTAVDCLVHTDFSGTQQGVSVGNVGNNRHAYTGSNPSARAITSPSGLNARDIIFSSSIHLSDTSLSGENAVKFDTGGASIRGIISTLLTQDIYCGSSDAVVNGNLLFSGRAITVPNGCTNVDIKANTFINAADIRLAANPGLAGDVTIEVPAYAWRFDTNFLPNYGTIGGPFWTNTTKLSGKRPVKSLSGGTVSSSVYLDVPGSVFALDKPAIIELSSILANLSTGDVGNIAVCKLDGTIISRYRFTGTPGTPANFQIPGQDFPVVAGNPYYPRLERGSYKLMINSSAGTLDLLAATIERWGA